MKTAQSHQTIRQGDVLLIPVGQLPAGAERLPDRIGIRIEGERTGHAHQLVGHVAVADDGREFVRGGNVLTHPEHEAIATAPTWYEVRLQREYTPTGLRGRRWAD